MNLRDRLRLLKAAGASRAQEPGAAIQERLPPPGEPVPVRPAGPRPEPVLLGTEIYGYAIANAHGETFYVETRYPVEYCRGPLPLEEIFAVPGRAWELLGRIPATVDMRRAVFFDTETTGLAGGSGTYAFLVGLGFFEGHDFVVRQYFLRDYPEEEAMLEAIAADLAPFDLLVTFNGKSFDWPLMETRCRMARRRPPLAGAPHLDLLHPARRVWKERLEQCNLTNLEAQVLGVERQGDVPGHLIPQLYFEYLRTGHVDPLAGVILHNRLDIVSLVSLGAWLGRIVTDPFSPTPDGELVCGDDLFSLGRLFEARGLLAESVGCYEAACQRGVTAVSETRVLRELSQAYKRMKEYDRALTVWQNMTEGQARLSLYPYIEMAKYYEHVARDYFLARAMALRALEIAERRRSVADAAQDWQEVQHRLGRIERKLQGQGQI